MNYGRLLAAALSVVMLASGTPVNSADKLPLKVFILAGQSNMQGAGAIQANPQRNEGKGSLEYLVNDPATSERFAHLVDKQGEWATRDDVWIWNFERKGELTVGYGARDDSIGPELQFGHVVGDHFE